MNQSQSKQSVTEAGPIGCAGLIVRMTWLMGGNLALLILAGFIFEKKAFSAFDIAYWAVVAGLVLIRYVDITRLRGLTSDSEPATLKHWRVYTIKLLAAFAALWGLAHGVPYVMSL